MTVRLANRIILALGAILIATPALAQQKKSLMLDDTTLFDNRTIYGSDGRVISRSTTDTSGQTTVYGADGRVRERIDQTGTIYGSDGRIVGKADRSKR